MIAQVNVTKCFYRWMKCFWTWKMLASLTGTFRHLIKYSKWGNIICQKYLLQCFSDSKFDFNTALLLTHYNYFLKAGVQILKIFKIFFQNNIPFPVLVITETVRCPWIDHSSNSMFNPDCVKCEQLFTEYLTTIYPWWGYLTVWKNFMASPVNNVENNSVKRVFRAHKIRASLFGSLKESE